MSISVRAKFENHKNALDAMSEIDSEMHLIESKIFSKKSIENYFEKMQVQKLRNDSMWAFLSGGSIGILTTLSIKLLIDFKMFNSSSNGLELLTLLLVGFSIGSLLGLSIVFIKRESLPNLSPDDIHQGEVLTVFKVEENRSEELSEIIKNYRPMDLHFI